jgi:hypothetical protein
VEQSDVPAIPGGYIRDGGEGMTGRSAMHLVQIARGDQRAVAVVEGKSLHLLRDCTRIYDLALSAIHRGKSLTDTVRGVACSDRLDYESVYEGKTAWRLLVPIDHPDDPARVTVSGTGLTHKVSAESRAAMHGELAAQSTDSMRMYQMGKDGGRPAPGSIGVQPEWFYKGNGTILRTCMEELVVPPYAEDGGEEPEIAGIYLIADDGQPYRLGFALGNEFSDHTMERQNYLYLAPSKLRNCSLGPELIVGSATHFANLSGSVAVEREGSVFWQHAIHSGEVNMCHSLANLEHHHFKYEMHRRPGDVHIHFFGADAFSFGENVALKDGDLMEVAFSEFGKPLRNPIRFAQKEQSAVQVRALA